MLSLGSVERISESSSRTLIDMSPIGVDFSWITLLKERTPELDKNKRSVPVFCTESRDTHPTPSITSTKRNVDGVR